MDIAWLVALGLLSATPKQAVIAGGDCRDPDLIGVTRDLTQALVGTGQAVLSPDAIGDQLAPASGRSVEELARQLQAAQNEFYSGEYNKAEAALKSALADINRLPPSQSHFNLLATANLTYALLLKGTGRGKDADALFSQVLRLSPAYRMDPDYYSPGTRKRFDRIRRTLARGAHPKLTVRSNPSGAEISLDGKPMGRTPAMFELPPGTFTLRLVREGQMSFPRVIDLDHDLTATVDLAYETSVDAERVPCVKEPTPERALESAARLGNLLGLDKGVLLRLEHRATPGPRWITATLFQLPSGQKIREGALKWEHPNRSPDGLIDLVTFLTTGEAGGRVVTSGMIATAPAPEQVEGHAPQSTTGTAAPQPAAKPPATVVNPASDPQVAAAKPSSPPQVATAKPMSEPQVAPAEIPAAALPSVESEASPWHGRRLIGLSVAGGGALAAVIGALFEAKAHSQWSSFDGFYASGAPGANDAAKAAAYRDAASKNQTLGTVFLVGGAAMLGGGAYLYFTAPKHSGVSAALALGPSSAALVVTTP